MNRLRQTKHQHIQSFNWKLNACFNILNANKSLPFILQALANIHKHKHCLPILASAIFPCLLLFCSFELTLTSFLFFNVPANFLLNENHSLNENWIFITQHHDLWVCICVHEFELLFCWSKLKEHQRKKKRTNELYARNQLCVPVFRMWILLLFASNKFLSTSGVLSSKKASYIAFSFASFHFNDNRDSDPKIWNCDWLSAFKWKCKCLLSICYFNAPNSR